MTLFTPTPSSLLTLQSTPKTILITGSSSGIGLATARLLSTLNPAHNLILLDLHPPPPTFTHPATHTLFHPCNVTSWPSQRAAFAAGFEKFSRIDYVFVNAGIAEHGDPFFSDTLDPEDGLLAQPDKRVLAIDLDAAVDTTKLAIHYLRKNRTQVADDDDDADAGAIVLTASLAGYLASAGAPLYSAAKHGIVGLMRALKQECAKLKIAISLVAPGITVTPILTASRRSPTATATATTTPDAYARDMASAGVPINKAEDVALAV